MIEAAREKTESNIELAMNEKFEQVFALLKNEHAEISSESVKPVGESSWIVHVDP